MKRRVRQGAYARWLCAQECHYTRRADQHPCRFCCGFTANTDKHFQGSPAAATKN
jgi:hypothetical protein